MGCAKCGQKNTVPGTSCAMCHKFTPKDNLVIWGDTKICIKCKQKQLDLLKKYEQGIIRIRTKLGMTL